MSAFRCGTIALLGRPNSGKSSLLNRIVGAKVAIVSPKPQTTRHAVSGILTTAQCQYVFLDAPGFQTRHLDALNRALNRRAAQAARDADVVGFVVAAPGFGAPDRAALRQAPGAARVVAIVNMIDRLESAALLPFVDRLARERRFEAIVPVSARTGRNLGELLRVLGELLPEGPAGYPPGQLTDRDERFLAAEILREKLFRLLGAELPYRCEVVLQAFRQERRLRRVEATVWVERDGQKPIVVGADGARLKQIASDARRDMERLFGGRVYLGVWVKVKRGWSGDAGLLQRLGYG